MSGPRDDPRHVDIAARTNRGLVRSENQDVLVVDGWACGAPESDLDRHIALDREFACAVVDGMGGHQGGAVAAWLTAHHIANRLGRSENINGADDFAQRGHELVSAAGEGLGMPDMGAAFAALVLDPAGFGVANVGDCRVYRLSEGQLVMLSVDDVGASRSDPTREVLTQSIGGGGRHRLDAHWFASPWPAAGTQRFVLATDGLAVVDSDTVALIACDGSPEGAVAALVTAAMNAGAPDNVTVMVVDVRPKDCGDGSAAAGHACA